MSVQVRGQTDESLDAVIESLTRYEAAHTSARIDIFRQSFASIRVRIVDPDFARVSRTERHDRIWAFLEELSEEILSQISTVLLLTPEEHKKSFASVEFDEPVMSSL